MKVKAHTRRRIRIFRLAALGLAAGALAAPAAYAVPDSGIVDYGPLATGGPQLPLEDRKAIAADERVSPFVANDRAHFGARTEPVASPVAGGSGGTVAVEPVAIGVGAALGVALLLGTALVLVRRGPQGSPA